MSESQQSADILFLNRKLDELTELCHQAIALASAANVRGDGLAAALAKLESRITALRVESKTISELVG